MTDLPKFAPLPLQVIGDTRLSRTDIDVVAVIAWHDRLGKNGRGCYAGNATLAVEVGIQEPHLSRSLTKLEQLGILEKRRDSEDRRKRIYHLKYLDNPRIVTNAGKYTPAPAASDEIVTNAGNDSAEYLPKSARYLPTAAPQPSETESEFVPNRKKICSETKNRSRETAETDGAEAPALQVEPVQHQRALESLKRAAVETLNAAIASQPRDVQRDICALEGDAWTRALEEATEAEIENAGAGILVLLRAATEHAKQT
jgi:DNA-binding transcriptional ArsR family regulator